MQVHLKNHFMTKTYTSGSVVAGDVTITTQRYVRFDTIEIILLGSGKTWPDGYSAHHESTYTFLKLIMPIPKSVYPVPRVLESSRTLSDFNYGEQLPLMILANWRGFSGGQRDMYNEVLKYGSFIVDSSSAIRCPH
jgi:hypothetical protein